MKNFLFLLLFTAIAFIERTEERDPSEEGKRRKRERTMEHRYTPPQETQETQETQEEDFIPATYDEPTFISTDYDLAQMPALQRETTECIYPIGTNTRTATPSDDFGRANHKSVRDPRRRKNKKYGKVENQRDKHSKKPKKSKKSKKTKTRTMEYYSEDADWSSKEDYRGKLVKLRRAFLNSQTGGADLSSDPGKVSDSDSDITWGTDEITVLEPYDDDVESMPLRSIKEDSDPNRIPYHRRYSLTRSPSPSSETELVEISRPRSRNRTGTGRSSPFLSQRQLGVYTNLGSAFTNVSRNQELSQTELNTIANSQTSIRSSRCNTPYPLHTSITPNPVNTSNTSIPLNTSITPSSTLPNQLNTITSQNTLTTLTSTYDQSNDPISVDLQDDLSSYTDSILDIPQGTNTGVDVDNQTINLQGGDTNSKEESLTATDTTNTTTKDTDLDNIISNPAIDIEFVDNGDITTSPHSTHDDDFENSSDIEVMEFIPCDSLSKSAYDPASSSIPLELHSTSVYVPVVTIPSRNQPIPTLTITNNTEIDDDEVSEQMKTLMSQLKSVLLIMAAVTFSSIILYSIYYINLIRKIYSKNRISK